jgi:CRISPR-associated protein Csm5
MSEYRMFDVEVQTLTPLHIGTGRELLKDFDFAVKGERTYRLNEDAILEEKGADDAAAAAVLAGTPPAHLVEDLLGTPAGDALVRYALRGTPRPQGAGARLREQIKSAYDEVYLPGSSVKGALRTSVLRALWAQKAMKPVSAAIGRSAKFAAQPIEKELMGRDPNHDLLRALQVSDSAPRRDVPLIILNARVVTRRGIGGDEKGSAPIEMEAIPSEQTFRLTVRLDQQIFGAWAQRAELPSGGLSVLEQLPALVQQHATATIAGERKWFEGLPGGAVVAAWYAELAGLRLGNRRCLMQLGWGTGWESKTLGVHLRSDGRFMQRIMDDYRMTRGIKVAPEKFPASRRVVMNVSQDVQGRTQERIMAPFGWCVLTFKERK